MAGYFKRIGQKIKSLGGHKGTAESASEAPLHPVSETETTPLPPTEDNTETDTSPLPDENLGTKDAAVPLLFPSNDRQDLWREAFLKLDDAERAVLDFAPAIDDDGNADESDDGSPAKQEDMASAIKEILGTANALKEKDEEKQYTAKLNKVIDGTTKVKSLIDAGLAFDPTKYGALAWAILSFGLHMAINAREIRDFMFDACDDIVNIVARYSIYKIQYRSSAHPSGTTEALQKFEEGVTDVYTSILQFLAEMKGYLNQNWLEHGAAAIFPKAERSLSKTKQSIITQDLAVQYWLPILEHESIQSQFQTVLKNLNALVKPTYANPITEYSFLVDQERAAVLRWLPDGNMDRIHTQIRSRAEVDFSENYQPGVWLLKHIDFQIWADAQSSCGLWLYGDMGTGKTVLTSTVIKHLEQLYTGSSQGALAYFYCSAAESTRTDPLDILQEILRQLASTKPGLDIFRNWQQDKKPSALTRDAVLRLILQMIDLNAHRQTTIVIDALDEIDRDGMGLTSIADALHYLLEAADGVVKIFVSSRPQSRIRDQLQSWTGIPVDPESTRSGMETYIELEVDRLLRHKHRLVDLKPKVKETLKQRAGGMFRYVQMSTEWICRGESPLEIKQAIAELPSELSGIYRDLFGRIQNRRKLHQDYARLAISWILGMRLVLRADDLLRAVIAGMDDVDDEGILETSIDDILTACEGIVTYNKARDVLELGHVSVIEFIQKDKQDLYDQRQVHTRIGTTCVRVLEGMHRVYHTSDTCPPESHDSGHDDDDSQLLRKRMEFIGHWACLSCLTISDIPQGGRNTSTFIQYANFMWAYHCGASGSLIRAASLLEPTLTTLRKGPDGDMRGALDQIEAHHFLYTPCQDSPYYRALRWIKQFANAIHGSSGMPVRLLVTRDPGPGSKQKEELVQGPPFAVFMETMERLFESVRDA
ncbi:uncharacterized protein B0H64DRAFT_462192 [Chaetomium fimeti]|uniref:NACHT domain-containing protein n=1 Tax=Chaetomium fimeti TaxID=1854472 RepID=A0AAE0LQL3_9PEZI|nr:hypothetical protein B0H64DRAFT_462192 [Chaetomium fimeti]